MNELPALPDSGRSPLNINTHKLHKCSYTCTVYTWATVTSHNQYLDLGMLDVGSYAFLRPLFCAQSASF